MLDNEPDALISAATDMARAFLKSQGYFVDILWHRNDIHTLCEQEGWPPLSERECDEVFKRCAADFDGENGLTWPMLIKAITAVTDRRQ